MKTRRVEAFLLRLVVDEQPGGAAPSWRGRVQHVGSGSEHQFEHLQDVLAFINSQLADHTQLVWAQDAAAE